MRTLWQLAHGLDVRSKWMARHLGVTGPQRLVLRIVGQQPGIGANALASTLGMHPSTLTGIVRRLEDRRLLVRSADPDDGRRVIFELTAKGRKLDGERRGTVEASVRRALARSGDGEIAHTEAVLARLVAELERTDD